MIYFDHSATSFPKPPSVIEAVIRAMGHFGNPSRGAHPFSLEAGRAVEWARRQVAGLFGCSRPERVVFTKSVTEALNLAINSVEGHLVTTEAEHNSILRPAHRRGHVTVVPVDGQGRYEVQDIARAVRPDTRAVVLAQASNLTGNPAPVDEIGRFCRQRDLFFIVDTAQTAGLLDLDMERAGVDALCFTGHKSLYGLTGTGGLCLSPRFTPRPLIVGGTGSRTFEPDQPADLPDRLEAGTLNVHGLAALSAGIGYVRERGAENLWRAADRLARRLYEGARKLRGVAFYGDYQMAGRAPIVTLNLGQLDSGEVAGELADHGIAVRAGAHCAPLLHRRFGTVERGAVRFSFSHQNTEAEVDRALEVLAGL